MNKLKLLDLFSGIGGFSLGLESTGYFQTIAFVEKDKFCRQVLQKNFKNIPIEEDIRNVRGSDYAADVITGGFPCQPFSVAGKRKGTADDRYLWDETIRVIAECKPRWFIGENVEGLININNGMVLRQVQTDLEEQGFQVQCLVIPAAGIGAWHQRKRIWIMGYAKHNGRSSSTIKGRNGEINEGTPQGQDKTSQFTGASRSRNDETLRMVANTKSSSGVNGDVSNSISTGGGRRRVSRNVDEQGWNTLKTERESLQSKDKQTRSNDIEQSSEDVSNSNSRLRRGRGTEFKNRDDREGWFYSEEEKQTRNDIRSEVIGCNAVPGEDVPNTNTGFGIRENQEIQTRGNAFNSICKSGKRNWWQTQSEFCGVPNGVSYELDKNRSSRIKALGNSIVPQIARQIGLSIMKGELTNNE
jgi:DNA (cytosine-5)-methyltransferase 1